MDAKQQCQIELELYTQFGSAGRKIGGPKLQDARGVDGNPHLLVVADCWTNQVNLYRHHKGEIHFQASMKLTGADGVLKSPRDVALFGDKVLVVDGTANVRVFKDENGVLETTYTVNKGSKVNLDCIAANVEGDYFLVADKITNKVSTHNLTKGLLRTLDVGITPAFMTFNDGKFAVSDHEAEKVCIFDVESGAMVSEFRAPSVRGVSFHQRSVIAACSDGLFGSGSLRQYVDGELVGKIADGLFFPQGMAFLSHDKLAVADKTTAKVFRVRPLMS
ncbi:uncharacterized protein [Amphiura filiformis]|uniref:uncharacterized protein n=1 Tax=Amphiura filiformis TaxID=82378 RepID=UPI003B218AD4